MTGTKNSQERHWARHALNRKTQSKSAGFTPVWKCLKLI